MAVVGNPASISHDGAVRHCPCKRFVIATHRFRSVISAELKPVVDAAELIEMQRLVRRVPAPKIVVESAVKLARMTRPGDELSPAVVKEFVSWGAGPRASQYLVLGAKARAAMDGRPMADLEDLAAVVLPVLRHRIVVNFNAEASGKTADEIVREVMAAGK